MSNGFYIRKLKVIGRNVPPAQVEFREGLNVIYGPSNTGKSYIFGCLNYMLGGSEPPKEIPQSENYQSVFLEISSFDKEVFTLKRNLSGGRFLLSAGPIEGFEERVEKTTLNEKRGKSGKTNNISDFLLSLCSIDDIYLKKNARNATERLSYSNLRHLTLVDEVSILKEESPIRSSLKFNWTKEKSAFEFLLTGKDAKGLKEVEEKKIFQTRIKGKVELIKSLIDKTNRRLKMLSVDEGRFEDILREIGSLSEVIENNNKQVEILSNQRKEIWVDLQDNRSKLLFKKELLQRFKLLEEHYKSDLQRLEFIEEGDHLISQLKTAICPICGTEMTEDHINHFKENGEIAQAIEVEIEKIRLKLLDLIKTVEVLENEIIELDNVVKNNEKRIQQIDDVIKNEIGPVLKQTSERLEFFNQEQKKILESQILKGQLTSYYSQLKDLDDQSKKPPKADEDEIIIGYKALKEFCEEVEKLLGNWNYPELTSVEFNTDSSVFDIDISGVKRKSNGKGFRAITYSSFIVGLLKYCVNKDLHHPRNIVLDSPLTTYHGIDSPSTNPEEVPKDIQDSFYHDLADIGNNKQIIILENKIPPREVKQKIKFIEFTRKLNTGRYGFFPV